MERLMRMNDMLNGLVWGKWMILLLLFCGIWLMIVCRFLPFRRAGLIFRKTIGSLHGKKQSGITSFQAVSTALAGTLGVGSIVGVSTALTIGGAGALFWMCISALFGMMTKYGEVVLAIRYRVRVKDGEFLGGPMTTLENGCHLRFLGVLFALLCMFASFGIGNLTPANTIVMTVQSYVPVSSLWIGILLAVIIGLIISGKAKGIMRFNEISIPIISILYLLAILYLLFCFAPRIPHAVSLIWESVCTPLGAVGGAGGYFSSRAVHYGISRGVFSNEAGMGSSPLSYASVSQADPVEQGFWGIFEVFFDTLIVCFLTGLMILSSSSYESGKEGAELLAACFEEGFGPYGALALGCAILFFALPSIIGWYYYGTQCIRYLFRVKWMLSLYKICFLLLLIGGGLLQLRFAWEVADTLNGLMAIPNLISLVLLYKVVVKLTKEYIEEHGSD